MFFGRLRMSVIARLAPYESRHDGIFGSAVPFVGLIVISNDVLLFHAVKCDSELPRFVWLFVVVVFLFLQLVWHIVFCYVRDYAMVMMAPYSPDHNKWLI